MKELKKLKYGVCGGNKTKPCWVYFFHLVPTTPIEGCGDCYFIKVGVTNSGTPHDRYKGINNEGVVRLYDVRGLSHIRLDWSDYPEANVKANEIEAAILKQWEIEGGTVNKRGPTQIDLLYSHKGNSEVLILKSWSDETVKLIRMVGKILTPPQCIPPTDHRPTPAPKVPQT